MWWWRKKESSSSNKTFRKKGMNTAGSPICPVKNTLKHACIYNSTLCLYLVSHVVSFWGGICSIWRCLSARCCFGSCVVSQQRRRQQPEQEKKLHFRETKEEEKGEVMTGMRRRRRKRRRGGDKRTTSISVSVLYITSEGLSTNREQRRQYGRGDEEVQVPLLINVDSN